jgi:hypothetical protein
MIMLKANLSDIAKPRTGRVRPMSRLSNPNITLVFLPEPKFVKTSHTQRNSELGVS